MRCCSGNDVEVDECETMMRDGRNIKVFNIVFGQRDICFKEEPFDGAEVKASFAGVTIDLRDAVVNDGAVLSVICSFAGVEVFIPADVEVDVISNSAFGGVENNHNRRCSNTYKKIFIKPCTATRKNMNRLMSEEQFQLLNSRNIIENVWSVLKLNYNLIYHRARSITGMFRHFFRVNVLSICG